MNIITCKTAQDAGIAAATLFAGQVIQKPNAVLGLATGGTVEPVYEELIRLYKEGFLSFEETTTFNLDEYVGLSAEHDQSYRYFMQNKLFDHVDIVSENTHVPNGMASDLALECASYEAAINAAGGIDMQLLGVGPNGHIAFNEPSDVFENDTNVVSLTQSTIEANKRFFSNADANLVPRQALTMGIGTIMRAKKLVMVITGENKREVTKAFLESAITPQLPISVLKLHQNVTVVLDKAAAGK